MLVTEKDYLARKEYYADQRRAAERWTRVRAALAARDRSDRLYAKAISWLGDRLVAWGSRLQEHYDTVVSSTMSKTAKPAVGR
jgi:hypothetical protein